MAETLAAPAEYNETVEEAAPRRGRPPKGGGPELTIAGRPPTMAVTIPGPGGKPRVVEVVDKSAIWSAPDADLRARAANIAVRPASGKVLVTDSEGRQLARFANIAQAALRLQAAGVKMDDLAGAALLKPKKA